MIPLTLRSSRWGFIFICLASMSATRTLRDWPTASRYANSHAHQAAL
ncbi:MAG: hypothetical protein NT049_15955 [Planctomycetota bacterium]|nr:hypothetical protein [Planctomycetota bacterium]